MNFTRVLVLLMWMSGCLDWTTQGFRHRCTHCPMATQPNSDRNWVPSHQTTALLVSLGKFEPNREILNQARLGFDCRCLSAALPAYTNVPQVRWAQPVSPYGTWNCVDYSWLSCSAAPKLVSLPCVGAASASRVLWNAAGAGCCGQLGRTSAPSAWAWPTSGLVFSPSSANLQLPANLSPPPTKSHVK